MILFKSTEKLEIPIGTDCVPVRRGNALKEWDKGREERTYRN